ncbi:CHAP domain-containing protein [Nocardioides sp. YIM 152315]|uniref:CHAP domain-containing protein n=1 Tax=Nocardioides sp. YIM 152315 TaxID=3031760 RepID=UPI0023DA2426|nr:CHAP domain-containing protein [Nocardioides sp. YIM 152315]MDF1602434.1 CHAP domain-containing protein [Nocardioides sp. YIM 152315]
MSHRNRLRAPLIAALLAAVISGLPAYAPAASADRGKDAGPGASDRHDRRDGQDGAGGNTKAALLERELAAAADGLTRSRVRFKKSAYLCYGYQNCADAGMGNAGYAQANKKMYWRMYAGHNCTNYAAYRMVQNGMPNARPWSGGGNATYWGTSVPGLTDGNPSAGAVAWWKANQGPAGSAGHVAYVEQVVSADEIIISQDSWRGDFSWARVTRSSGNWPSGFIHFTDLTVQNTAAPVITGDLRVGTRLTASAGGWTPAAAAVRYQWFADGRAIKKGKNATLALGRRRVGQVISVQATASRSGYNDQTASSAPTAPVRPGLLGNTVAPTIRGTAKVRGTLRLGTGSWSPVPSAYAYTWYADGQPIPGATGTSLALTPDLAGRTIDATVTAGRAGFSNAVAPTATIGPIAPGTIRVRKQPTISGAARPGRTLTVATGSYRPRDASTAVQWLRDGQPIAGATAATYTLAAGDLGSRISASVTASRAGYAATSLTTTPTVRVKVLPRIKVQRVQLRHGVRLVIHVVARHVPVVQGKVAVRVKGGFREKVALNKRGVARVVVTGLKQGRHPARVGFTGSGTVSKSVRKAAIRMPAPKRH